MAQETVSPAEQLPTEEILLTNALAYAKRIDQETSVFEEAFSYGKEIDEVQEPQKEQSLFNDAFTYGGEIDQSLDKSPEILDKYITPEEEITLSAKGSPLVPKEEKITTEKEADKKETREKPWKGFSGFEETIASGEKTEEAPEEVAGVTPQETADRDTNETIPEEVLPPEIIPPENLPPQKQRLLGRIAQGTKAGLQHWVNNFDPRGKDRYWTAGVAFGLIEAGVVVLPGGGWVRGALNLAAAQGAYAVTRLWEKRMAANIEKEFKYKDLTSEFIRELREKRLKEIEHSHRRADVKIKNIVGGVSAGATALSLYGIASSIGPEMINAIKIPDIEVPDIKIPEIKIPEFKVPGGPPTTAPETPQPTVPTSPASPNLDEIDKIYQGLEQQHADVLGEAAKQVSGMPAEEASKILHDQAAAAVGAHLDQTHQAISEYLQSQHIDQAGLSEETIKGLEKAVQNQMEQMSNQSFFEAAAVDPDHVGDKGAEFFAQRLTDHQDQLVNAAQQAFEQSQAVNEHLARTINLDLLGGQAINPGFYTEVVAREGTNFGQLLVDQNIDVGHFGAPQSEVFGAHIAANYDSLKDMWIAMDKAGEFGEAKAVIHFPMSLSELDNIIKAASEGDEESIKKLKDALYWIKTGKSYKILSPKAVMDILAILKKG